MTLSRARGLLPQATPPQRPHRSRLVLLLLLCVGARLAGASVSCGTGYPLRNAGWQDVPPYIYPSNCRLEAQPPAVLQRCLAGRQIFILGNSIARNYQAELSELVGNCQPPQLRGAGLLYTGSRRRRLSRAGGALLSASQNASAVGAAAPRLLPRKPAPKRDPNLIPWAQAGELRHRLKQRRIAQKTFCLYECQAKCARGKVDINYARVQYYGAPLAGFPRLGPHDGDVCGAQGVGAPCLKRLLANATADDVLLFQMGLYYFITPISFRAVARKWSMTRIHARVREDIQAFVRTLRPLFPGKIYFATTGPASPGKWIRVNKELPQLNNFATQVFGPQGAGFTILDQYAISLPHHTDKRLYNDYVHIGGPLTQAFLHAWMSDVCAGAAAGGVKPKGGAGTGAGGATVAPSRSSTSVGATARPKLI